MGIFIIFPIIILFCILCYIIMGYITKTSDKIIERLSKINIEDMNRESLFKYKRILGRFRLISTFSSREYFDLYEKLERNVNSKLED